MTFSDLYKELEIEGDNLFWKRPIMCHVLWYFTWTHRGYADCYGANVKPVHLCADFVTSHNNADSLSSFGQNVPNMVRLSDLKWKN